MTAQCAKSARGQWDRHFNPTAI